MKHSVTEYKLKNGASGLVINVPGSSVVSMAAFFNSGFIFGDRQKYEVPHVLEHLLYSGNQNFSIEVERNGAYANAFTSSFFNWYFYECAAFEQDRLLELLGRQLVSPDLRAPSLGKEIGNVQEELSRNTSNYGRLSYMHLAAKTTPGAVMTEEDRLKQLGDIKIEDVIKYHKKTHTASNLRFFFAGDWADNGEQFVKQFEGLISGLPTGQKLEIPVQQPIRLDKPIILKRPIQQLYYDIHSYFEQPDLRGRMALVLLSSLMTAGFRSWVLGEARQRGLAYSVSSGVDINPSRSLFDFSAFVTPGKSVDLFKLIAKGFERAKSGDFLETDLDETKNLVIGSVTRSHQTSGDMLGWYDGFYNFEGRVQDFDAYLKDLASITRAEIVEAANYATKGRPGGLSLVGDVTEDLAGQLYEILLPIWK